MPGRPAARTHAAAGSEARKAREGARVGGQQREPLGTQSLEFVCEEAGFEEELWGQRRDGRRPPGHSPELRGGQNSGTGPAAQHLPLSQQHCLWVKWPARSPAQRPMIRTKKQVPARWSVEGAGGSVPRPAFKLHVHQHCLQDRSPRLSGLKSPIHGMRMLRAPTSPRENSARMESGAHCVW